MSQMGIPSQLLLISYSPILTREKWKFTPSRPGMFHYTAKCRCDSIAHVDICREVSLDWKYDIFGAY